MLKLENFSAEERLDIEKAIAEMNATSQDQTVSDSFERLAHEKLLAKAANRKNHMCLKHTTNSFAMRKAKKDQKKALKKKLKENANVREDIIKLRNANNQIDSMVSSGKNDAEMVQSLIRLKNSYIKDIKRLSYARKHNK